MGVCLIYILATLELLQSAVVGDIISRGCATLALLLRTVHIKSSYMTIFLNVVIVTTITHLRDTHSPSFGIRSISGTTMRRNASIARAIHVVI